MEPARTETRWVLEYLITLYDEAKLRTRRTQLRDNLTEYIRQHGEEDEKGNLIFYFDKPMSVDDEEWYSGLMLQRRVSEYVNENTAKQIIIAHNLEDRCINRVVVDYVDYDALYAANQEGIVSDAEIDLMLEQDETWALTKMKC